MSTRRASIKTLPAVGAAFSAAGSLGAEAGAAPGPAPRPETPLPEHFHPRGKPPPAVTRAVLRQARTRLPFADNGDFGEQRRGLIAPMTDMTIRADDGHVAGDMQQ